jgi:hypothetical protein
MTRPGVLQEAQPEERQVQPKTNPWREVKVIGDIKKLKMIVKFWKVLFYRRSARVEKFGE